MAEINWNLLGLDSPDTPLSSYRQGRDWANQNAMRDMARQQAQQDIQSRNAFAQALQSGAGMDALFAASPEQAYQYSNAQAQMQNSLTAQENAMRKREEAAAKRQQKERDKSGELLMFKTMFPGVEFQAQDVGDDYDIIPASYTEAQNVEVSEKVPKQTPQFSINEDAAKRFGFTPDDLGYVAGLYQLDPKAAISEMRELRKAARSARQTGKSTGSKIGFDDAMASIAVGVPVQGYEQYTPEIAKSLLEQTTSRKAQVSKAGASNISVSPQLGYKQAAETRGKEFGKYAMEATQSAQATFDAAGDIAMVVDGLRGMGGGPVAQFKAWAGTVMPPGTEWANMASMGELAKTVQTKLAPTMRMAGSGATSDFEMKAYMAAIPTLATTEKGRELMAKYANRTAERAQIRAEIVNDIEQSGRLPTPAVIASEMRRKIGDKFFDDADRRYFKLSPQKPSAIPAQSPMLPKSGWSIQRVN